MMSATVAAALKKIATAILTNPKALKKIGIAILVILIVFFLPVIVLLGVTSGEITIDTDRLQELVMDNLSDEETAKLQALEDKMGEIHDLMTDRGFSSAQAKEAQVLYVMALNDYRNDADFDQKLIYGFYQAQSDEQLIAQINTQFGTQIKPEDFTNVMRSIREQHISVTFTDPATKNNLDLVAWARYAVDDGWGYVLGTYGKVLTEESLWARTDQYPYQVGRFFSFIKINWVGKRTADCIGLIKGYGFSSKGCFIRIGSTCKEMTTEEIQYRYKAQFTNEDLMLMSPSRYSPLAFDMMKILLTSRGFHVNENAFDASFNLRRNDGSYNLLAEILADHNMVPLIFVKFSGTDKTSISQRSDYGNQSILLGYQKMKDRLIAENICKTDTTVRPRKDEYLYDMDCVNEALVNMLVHNDWTITEPLISFYADRMVFTSHGGLPRGITKEEFFLGVSHPRNTVLMRIFLNLGIVEHTGHGVPTIVKKYGREAFDIHPSYIEVTIPFNRNVLALVPNGGTNDVTDNQTSELSDAEKKVILELIKNPHSTYEQMAQEIGISRRSISRVLTALQEKKYIKRIGNNKSGYWTVIR